MTTKTSINMPLAFVAILLLGSAGFGCYYKYNLDSKNIATSLDQTVKVVPDAKMDIQGRIISINTNAKNLSFIKVKDVNSQNEYNLSTYLDIEQLGLNLGDEISFSNELEKSENGVYFILKASYEIETLKKNTVKVKDNNGLIELSEITPDMQGQEVTTYGSVSNLYTSSKGHTFFTIKNKDAQLKGVLFAAENTEMTARLDLLNQYNNKDENIYFKGKVDIYKEELEIITSKIYK